ncbi:dihydrodipicolinate synthase family protein [Niabella drilacis]|uniref:N-acetylneuraminate lyase n=1 Tax=Niabella drilacis (strain DSM 25811 / CCM 8410 / CCUG 62505 / LMG 26954 / E90) TaxID=1285928 RepID=A0A1G6S4Q7_NIADE|nr:dihydrodipicolinate synthase family protein [Niabella drilacis]SDD11691.1 N-acetylneuraminate lyase [Niabella drilacis]
MKEIFKGLWSAMFTPVDGTGAPEMEQLEKLARLLVTQGQDGLYVLGSTGQGVLFTEAQRKAVLEKVTEVVAGRVPVMVQVGALTTAESVRLAVHAAECGANAISSVAPIYFSGSVANALLHYRKIAEVTDLPFFPYQLGNNTMGDIPDFIERLLQIPNIAGMKLTTGQLMEISAIHLQAGDRLKLFSGADELMCHASLCGADGAIGSFYNLWGVACKKVLEDFREGDFEQAKNFMLEFQRTILYVLPNIWTFFRKAMRLKYGIDIGQTKAPLGLNQAEWTDEEVLSLSDKIEAAAGIKDVASQITPAIQQVRSIK